MALIRGLLVIVLTMFLVFPPFVYSGWLDNWFDQKVSTSPNYFEGQKRGYFTAGSFSARIPTSTDYLLSIELPRLKGGCGGIDMFFGGFGFTNFDYLVQKFQRLIQAAPAVAFQIALNTLSAQLGIETKDIEKIVNLLNQLQLNECSVLKPFTTIAIKDDTAGAQFVNAAETALKSTGITDLWNAIKPKGDKVETIDGSQPSVNDQIKGCSSDLQAFITGASSSGAILYAINKTGKPAELAPIIRGMIGDLYIKVGSSSYYPSITPSCTQNVFQSFKEGRIFKKTGYNDSCTEDNANSLTNKVASVMVDAFNRIKSKSDSYSQEEEKLMQASPLPVYKLLRYAAVTGDSTVIPVMADPIAKGMLYQAYLDIYMYLKQVLETIQATAEKTNNPSNPNDTCNVDTIKAKMTELLARMQEGFSALNSVYLQSLNEAKSVVEIVAIYQKFEEIVDKKLSEKFGAGIAARAFK